MLKSLTRDVVLAVQARTGASVALLVWIAVIALATLTAFAFLCVAGYTWFAAQFGDVFAALLMTGMFALVAAIGAMICALARRRARARAILERAARAHAPSWLLDPRMLATAVQLGRTIGWQRIIPVALFGFVAAQWAREYRERGEQSAE